MKPITGQTFLLPQRRFNPATTLTEPYNWQRRAIVTEDRGLVPIAWTSALLYQNRTGIFASEDEMLADPAYTRVVPTLSWGRSGSPLLAPRAILLGENLMNLPEYAGLFDTFATELAARNIFVGLGITNGIGNQDNGPIQMLLPCESDVDVYESYDDLSSQIYEFIQPTPTNWLGGEVQYLSLCENHDEVTDRGPHGHIGTISGTTDLTVYEHVAPRVYLRDQVIACHSRYVRVGYHSVYNQSESSPFDDFNGHFSSIFNGTIAELAAYGVTGEIVTPADTDAVIASFRTAIATFWNL